MKKPNILWIFSDQHRAQALSCYGDENINTPNLDRLAREGARFQRAYSNTPLCSPFRANLYTGKYCTTNGVTSLHRPLLPVHRTLAQELQEFGYYTSHMGKWHLSGGAAPCHFASPYFRQGWDEWLGWENSNCPFETEYSVGMGPRPLKKLEGYQTDILTDFTVEWIKNQPADRPWFHVVSIEPPHPPNVAPERFMEMFRDKEIKLRDNVPLDHPQLEDFKESIRCYYAQIANLDFNVGRIIKALEETNQLDDTIIFYFSDHGDLMGSHGRMHKGRPESESSQIPILIRYPWKVPQGLVTDALISAVDIAPTLLGMIGAPVPDYVEGEDLSKVVFGLVKEGAKMVLLQYESTYFAENPDERFRSVISNQWMYTVFGANRPSQLFDMEKDPYQMNNIVNKSEYAGIQQKLHRLLENKLEEIGDNFLKGGNDKL